MPSMHFFERSYWNTPWQEVVDPGAPPIEIAVDTLSPLFNGWAHQNTDGTYTVFLGEDIVLNGLGEPILGTLQVVVRMSQIAAFDPVDVLALFGGPFDPLTVYNAFHHGGEALFDTVFAGDDVIYIDSPATGGLTLDAPAVETGPGDDTIDGSEHRDTIRAGKGDDIVDGNGADDLLYGKGGRDDIDGGDGNDTLYGGNGADTVQGGYGDDVIHGGKGNDSLRGWTGDDVIHGNGGDDSIGGDADSDALYGDGGNDVLVGSGGADTLNGGRGSDTLFGGDDDDYLNGDRGEDQLRGDDGNDTLLGGGGNDVINGGDGFDTVVFMLQRAHYQVIVEDVYVEVRALSGNEGTDILFDVERLLFTDDVMIV